MIFAVACAVGETMKILVCRVIIRRRTTLFCGLAAETPAAPLVMLTSQTFVARYAEMPKPGWIRRECVRTCQLQVLALRRDGVAAGGCRVLRRGARDKSRTIGRHAPLSLLARRPSFPLAREARLRRAPI